MNKTIIFLFGTLLFLANGDNYAAAPLIVNIANDLNFSVNAAASSVTAYMLAFGAFTILFGPLSDRYGKVFIIHLSTFGTAIFSILGALAYDLPSLIFFRSINGAFAAGLLPVTLAYLGQATNDKERPQIMAKILSYGFLGAATATLIGGTIAHLGSWKLVYLTYGIMELILAFAMLKLMKRDEPISDKVKIISTYKTVLSHKGVLALLPLFLLMGFTVFGIFTYTGQLITQRFGYDIFTVGAMLSSFGVGIMFASKVMPIVREKLKHYYMPFNGSLIAFALIGLSSTQSPAFFCIYLFIFGAGFILFQPVFIAKIQEQIPHMKGSIMSTASFGLFVGGAIGTTVNGFIISYWGMQTMLYSAAIIIFITGLIAAIVMAKLDTPKINNAIA
jgi:predicted MFS family arabinose efflux permease